MIRRVWIFVAVLLFASTLYAQDASNSGNLTGAGQSVILDLDSFGAAVVQVSGTWTGTLEFEGSVNGTTFDADLSGHAPGSATLTTATGANGVFEMPVSGYARMQVRASVLSSGTAVVSIRASKTPSTGPIIAVHTGLTDTQLRATPVPISGTVTTTEPQDATASGTITAAFQAVSLNSIPDGYNTVLVQLTTTGGLIAGSAQISVNGLAGPIMDYTAGTIINQALTSPSFSNVNIQTYVIPVFPLGGANTAQYTSLSHTGANYTVQITASKSETWTFGAATAANQSTEITSLQILDDVVDTTGTTVPASAAFVAGTDGTNTRALKTDTNGELQVDILTMPTSDPSFTDATGTTVPANAAFVAGTDGTNTRALKTDVDGNLQIECLSGCGGAASFEDDDAFTGGTTSVNVIGALYDTTPPSITDGSAGAPRMDSSRYLYTVFPSPQAISGTVTVTDGAGALNVIVDSGSITATGAAADGAAVSGNPVRIAGKDGSGNTQDLVTDTTGDLQIDQMARSDFATLQSAATSSGDGTIMTVTGYATAIVTVNCSGCIGDVVIFEGSGDGGSNYIGIESQRLNASATYIATSATTAGVTVWAVPLSGMELFKARLVRITGTVTVTARVLAAPFSMTRGYVVGRGGEAAEVRQSTPPTNDWGITVRPVFSMGNGVTTTDTPRVTISNDSTGVLASVGSITNALPAGNNNIGDVDVASVIPGTGATNLGKAEDAASASADTGVVTLAVRRDSASTLADANGDYSAQTVDSHGATRVTLQHVNQVNCTISSTATTSTVITGCTAPGANTSIYISTIAWYSSIISTTTNFMTIQSGTGGNCGASVDVLYRGFAQVAFSGREVTFPVPIKVPANEEVCLLHPGAGTRLVTITGHIGPG